MINKSRSLIMACLIFSCPLITFADSTSHTAIPMETVIQKLETSGYHLIRKVELKEGHYKATIIDSYARKIKIRFNAQATDIPLAKVEPGISMMDAIKKVEAAGYTNISKITIEDTDYKVRAIDKNGKQTKLLVKIKNGGISKEWF